MSNGMTRIGIVEQKVGLYQLEAEAWLQDHQRTMFCFDLEELLGDGVHLFRSINRLDESWRDFVFDNPDDFDREIDDRIHWLYKKWLSTSRNTLELFEQLMEEYENRGFDVSLAHQLQSCCGEADGIVADSATFFSSDELASVRDAAIDEHEAGETVEMNVFGE